MNEVFVGLLVAVTLYALLAGGAPERLGAAFYFVSCFASHLSWTAHGTWHRIELGVFAIDVVTFLFFCWLSIRACRFWPIWVSGLLGLGVLGHLAKLAEPGLFWWAYAVSLTIWSYPILGLMALGTWAHSRRRRRFGGDPAWMPAIGMPNAGDWQRRDRRGKQRP